MFYFLDILILIVSIQSVIELHSLDSVISIHFIFSIK